MINEPHTGPLPLISVVTVVRNGGKAFTCTWNSVRQQSYPFIEYIIIDGSDSPRLKAMIGFNVPVHIVYINEPDQGIYDAMNKGWKLAKGEWIQFLNAGDIFCEPDTLQTIFGQKHNDCDVIYGDSMADYQRFHVYQKARDANTLWKGMPFRHQSVFFRKEALTGLTFNMTYEISADHDLICSLHVSGRKFKYVPVPVVIYDAFGVSNQKIVKSCKEQFRISRKHFRYTPIMHIQSFVRLISVGLVQVAKRILPGWLYLRFVRSLYTTGRGSRTMDR